MLWDNGSRSNWAYESCLMKLQAVPVLLSFDLSMSGLVWIRTTYRLNIQNPHSALCCGEAGQTPGNLTKSQSSQVLAMCYGSHSRDAEQSKCHKFPPRRQHHFDCFIRHHQVDTRCNLVPSLPRHCQVYSLLNIISGPSILHLTGPVL